MALIDKILIKFSGISHIIYGLMAIFLPFYIDEFNRYQLPDLRILVGFIQIISGFFLVSKYQKIYIFSSSSLALLMLGAIVVRIFINDPFYLTLPAIFYFFLNSYLTYITSKIFKS